MKTLGPTITAPLPGQPFGRCTLVVPPGAMSVPGPRLGHVGAAIPVRVAPSASTSSPTMATPHCAFIPFDRQSHQPATAASEKAMRLQASAIRGFACCAHASRARKLLSAYPRSKSLERSMHRIEGPDGLVPATTPIALPQSSTTVSPIWYEVPRRVKALAASPLRTSPESAPG